MKHKKRALFQSVISLILCLSMLVGTTFAWFTDSVSSTGNIIKSGNLKIEMEWTDDLQPEEGAPVWTDASKGAIFNYEHWEPGYTDLKYLQISNKGNLAFQYQLTITEGTVSEQDAADNGDAVTVDETTGEVIEGGKVTTPVSDAMKLAEVIDVYYANVTDKILTREQAKDQLTKIGTLADMINGRLATAEGVLLAVGSESDAIPSANVNAGSTTAAIMLKMRENAGNTYMGLNPKNGFSVQVVATQFAYEKDSFGKDYDTEAVKVELQNFSNSIGIGGSFGGSASIETDDQGMTTAEVAIGGEEGGAVIPAGVKTETGTTELTLAVTKKDSSEANITFGENENLLPLDVHITGISPDNTTPIRVNLGKVLPVGMNMGGVKLYHVENGVTNPMIQVSSLEELDAHNEFYYDLLTGNVTVAMATFSEITLINDKTNVWQGGMATSFAGGDGSAENPYIIANADQLAYLGDRISNDNGTYGSAHYKLISNVNIGGESNYSENGVIWYPIGYNKAGGEIAAYGLDEIYFEPISAAKPGDKDGDVVAAAGENTWYTYGGSFKGVFDGNGHTITGIYQNTWAMKGDYDGHYYNDAMGLFGYVNGGTVKNLTIDNFYSEGEFAPTGSVTAYAGGSATFENIAITNSHPQTYNTGVAGIVGWDNGNNTDFTFKNITVDSSNIISALWGSWDVAAAGILGSLKNDSRATFDNCHVSATIDVYNDVCGNYQYYWYRYCGAFIGTVYRRLDDGKGALDLSNVTATNCTVNFGERHEYYYCEFEKNTQASYTEDYQFSRVPHTELNLDQNPVTCNHSHTQKEDKQAVYIPFYQLFGGYGWGVQGIDLETYRNLDIVADKQGIQESETEKSVKKFDAKVADYTAYQTETTVEIGNLFSAIAKVHPEIDVANVQVTVSPVGETSTANGVYNANTVDWMQGTLAFSGEGNAELIITDYNYCEPTKLMVTIVKPSVKFEAIADVNAWFETGTAVKISRVFSAMDEAQINDASVSITVECVEGNVKEEKRITHTTDWKQSEIIFSGEGVVKISITDDYFCENTSTNVTIKAPVDKFQKNDNAPAYIGKDSSVTLGELFSKVDVANPAIVAESIAVKVIAADGSDVSGVYTPDTADWTNGTLAFTGKGSVTITITDGYFCKDASVDVTITDAIKKFEVKEDVKTSFEAGTDKVTIGELFKVIADVRPELDTAKIAVTVEPEAESTAAGTYTPDTTDWTKGTLTFTGKGNAKITITDGYFCEVTELNVTVTEREPVHKFETKFTNDYTYRVGNQNTVTLSSLFKAIDGAKIGEVDVEVTGNNASGTYTANTTDWTKGTIQFSGTGIVNVTITDNDYCISVELTLEVVDAVNATSATSAKSNNVVLLNDVGFSTIEVSGGYTLYGNGFKMTATTDPMYDTMRAGFVTLDNGTLDNVQVICPNFSFAIIYNSQIKDSANTAVPSDSNNDARGNVRSAVMVTGNSKIVNSYVHGGRAAIFLRSGNLVVDGSTISGGAAANIHALSAQSLTLRNATLIQKPFQATVHDTSKTVMGFSGLFECGEDGNSTPLTLEGTLVQDAWINEEYVEYTPSAASSIVENALGKTAYLHDLDGDGKNESLNLGFTYIPQNTGGSTNTIVTDNRTNKGTVPYDTVDVGNVLASAKVYSYKNSNGTSDDFNKDDSEYVPGNQGTTAPAVSFTDTNADRVFETKFDTSDNRWESTLMVNLDNGNYTFSFDKLLVQKHGVNLTYTVKTESGENVESSKAISLTASGVTNYVLTVTDGDATHTVYFILTASKTSIPDPVVADTTGGTPLLVVKSKNSDWTVGIPALEGIKVKYYTVDGEVILDLATLTPTSKGKQNGTNNYWETSKDGYKLKVTCGVIHDTKSVYGMPVVVDNNGTKQLYFTISSTNGYVSTGTAARSVTLTYEFTDPNGKTVNFTKNYNVKYADYKDEAQYSYSDFVNGTMTDLLTSSSGGSSNCVTPDTLITLANGKQVRVDALTGNEQLLVWNMETGKLDSAPIMFVDSDPKAEYEVIHLYFSDGTDVKVISEHGFWDYDLNRYVYLDRNADKYIGHTFAKQSGSKLAKVKLTDVVLETEMTTAWSPVTAGHLCYFVNGMLSMPGGVGGLFNIFDVDPATMTYDYEAMAKDIEAYGLFTYEEMNAMVPLSEDMFNAAGGAYLKISIGKGNMTLDDLVNMIQRYSKYI